jgi:hypothetical protein
LSKSCIPFYQSIIIHPCKVNVARALRSPNETKEAQVQQPFYVEMQIRWI